MRTYAKIVISISLLEWEWLHCHMELSVQYRLRTSMVLSHFQAIGIFSANINFSFLTLGVNKGTDT